MNTSERLKACCDKINEHITEYNLYSKELEDAQANADKEFQKLKDYDASIVVLQTLAGGLQSNIKHKIVSVVQKALDATFPGMLFDMEFVTRRDKTECELVCTDMDGNKQSILDGTGGGVKDIISLALRIAVWSLDNEASSIIILDEPTKFVSKQMRGSISDLFQTLSRDLGIQFIIVSHIEELISAGSKIYKITKKSNNVSYAQKEY